MFYPITPDKIIKLINSFSNNKSAGPDNLPTPILKNCADVLSFPISYLVNLSFTTGEFPNLCKIAKVIPLFKKGDPLDCSNYRPIYSLSTFSKILENLFTSLFTLFLRKIILFLSDNLPLGQLIPLMIQ